MHLDFLIMHGLHLREALYHMATIRYQLGEYEKARVCVEELYRIEPDNRQVSPSILNHPISI